VTEHAQLQWGTTVIPYSVRRSARRATVSIAVDPKDGVLVTAPHSATPARLEAVVRSRARWIVARVRAHQNVDGQGGREFVSGETFLYLGRQYRLRLLSGSGAAPVALRQGWLEAPGQGGPDGTRDALVSWYQERAGARLPGMVSKWANRLGVQVADVLVRSPAKRWGSCDGRGNLRFNWRIVQAPLALVEYVVAHEVVHVVHADHGTAFWSALGAVMPDYEARRDRLRAMGRLLEW
jgi:predicted metal-dependent hydrolase